ncbi:ligand-binding sensor domain-containing protein [Pollutibacter soli]|uniref:ligand-binding sensor domain-containing protein n=1 Tax=Pollutibacter soli TaxID=3034157 RepID=UPI003013476A
MRLLNILTFLALGFITACQTAPIKKSGGYQEDTLFTDRNRKQLPDKSYNYVYNEIRYTDSSSMGVIIQNSLPKGGMRYTNTSNKRFPYVIYWSRITNITNTPLEITIDFPADSFPLPGTYLKLFLLPDTMTSEKLSMFDYGIKGLKSFLDSGFYKPTHLNQTIQPKEFCALYVAVLSSEPGGVVRTGFALNKRGLFYRVTGITPELDETQIPCGTIARTVSASKPAPLIIGKPSAINDPGLVSQYIRSIFQDSRGNYWFGPAGQSVVRYDGKTLRYFSEAEFFNNDTVVVGDKMSVHAIAEDQNGNLWFGTDKGVVKYDGLLKDSAEQGKSFKRYAEKEGLSNLYIGRKSILAAKSGKVWIGTGGGVFIYDPSADSAGGKCFTPFELIPSVQIKDIMEDQDGNIWFGTGNNGVFRYDPKLSGPGAIRNIKENDRLGDNYAGGIIQDKSGNFWFTMKGGICKYDGKTFTNFTSKDGLGGTEIWGIYLEKSGIIWITARGSTTRFDPSIPLSDPKAFTVFTEADGLNCCVQSMYQDKAGNMWWGAGAGLYRFDGKRFYQVKQKGPW